MGTRQQLHNVLVGVLGSAHVYFQPPANVQMQYPCIVYKRDDVSTQFAGNIPYRNNKRYQVTVIDKNPDSDIPDKVASLPYSIFDRNFATTGLNHDVFTLYF